MKPAGLICLSFAAMTQPTLAQTSAPTAPSSGSEGTGTIEDIVVTATRRDERLQEVPIAVSAVSSAALERSGISGTRELTQTIPALNFSRSNSAFQPTIRGIGTRGNGAGDESNVAVYVDGVYQPELSSLSFEFLNIERVEVLRGPQGTLFGRNSTGGLINVITADPSHDPGMKAALRYGRFNELSGQLYVTGGLSETVALDFAGLAGTDDGYIRDLVRGGRIGDKRTYAARTKLLIEPSDATSLVLTGSYSDLTDSSSVNGAALDGNTQARSLANNPGVLIPTEAWTSAPTLVREIRAKQASLSLEGRFDFGSIALESTSAYQHNEIVVETDNDATPINIGRTHTEPTSQYYSQELRLLSDTDGNLSWIGGAFLFAGKGEFDPIVSTTGTAGNVDVDTFIRSEQKVRSGALFGEATYRFTPDWSVVAGMRYTTESRDYSGTTERNDVVLSSVNDADTTFDEVTYRLILQRRFGTRANLYASYSRGFKSGVFNSFSTAANSRPTDPETLDAYEVGLKTDPLPWLRANFALFRYDYQDIQLSARDSSTNLIVLLNAANATLEGAEAEISAVLGGGFELRTYATYLDANYDRFPDAQIFTPVFQDQTSIGGSAATPIGNVQQIADVSGSEMLRAPQYTFGVTASYAIDTSVGELGASANVFRSAKYFWDVNNRLFQPAYTQLNAELSWAPVEHYRFSVWGKNLTDEIIYQQMLPSATADVVSFERPRTYGIAVQMNF